MSDLNRLKIAGMIALIYLFCWSSASGQESLLASAGAWFDRGMLFQEAGDARSQDAFAHAIRDLDQYINGRQADGKRLSRAYVLRAKCRMFQGFSRQAIPDLDAAIHLSPGDGDTYYLRSVADRFSGDSRMQIEDLKAAARNGNEKAQDELIGRGIPW